MGSSWEFIWKLAFEGFSKNRGANLKCCLLRTARFGREHRAGFEPFLGGDGGARPHPGLFPPQTITGQWESREDQQEHGWMERNGITEQEVFGAPIHCLLAEVKLPQSRWLEGRHTALLPGDFHSAGVGSLQPRAIPEQTLQWSAGRAHGLKASRPASWGFLHPEIPSSSHSPHHKDEFHQPRPLVTAKVSFWEIASLVSDCLTWSYLQPQAHLQTEQYPK